MQVRTNGFARELKSSAGVVLPLLTVLPVLNVLALLSGVIWDTHRRRRRALLRQRIRASADGRDRCRACHRAGLDCEGCRIE